VSYRELARHCERLAARLWRRWRVREGDRLAWLGGNHPAQLMLLFALARIGATETGSIALPAALEGASGRASRVSSSRAAGCG
jgi:acyl-coenzyme A synthetase/AMP-(fatty) acid ligase